MKRLRMLAYLIFIGVLLFTFYGLFVFTYSSIHSVVSNFQSGRNITFTNQFNVTDLDFFKGKSQLNSYNVLRDNEL